MSVLKRPHPSLKNQPLPTIDVDVARLFRISFYTTGEPFHGKTASKRFDDPARTKSKRFGTCYMGFSLECAIAETVLHDLMPVRGVFKVAVAELASRYVVRFSGTEQLRLADLTGANLKTTVGSGEISTVFPYDIPQAWAKALHAHPADVDGIQFVSKQLNDQNAVVVFDRAKHKLAASSYVPLMDVQGALAAITTLHISPAYS